MERKKIGKKENRKEIIFFSYVWLERKMKRKKIEENVFSFVWLSRKVKRKKS